MKPSDCRQLYLVVNPKPGLRDILPKLEAALRGGVDIIQLWNNWINVNEPAELIQSICDLAHQHNVPVFINECWEWLKQFPVDGIHLDKPTPYYSHLSASIGRPFMTGITVGNEWSTIQWAIDHALDYMSFCSMFPSGTATSCELVDVNTIRRARASTSMPIFVAGGINTENMTSLLPLGIQGIAVVSEIMKAKDPEEVSRNFKRNLIKP